MWHETKDEMIEFVGSILRLDTDQGAKRFTQGYYNLNMQDYYELNSKQRKILTNTVNSISLRQRYRIINLSKTYERYMYRY